MTNIYILWTSFPIILCITRSSKTAVVLISLLNSADLTLLLKSNRIENASSNESSLNRNHQFSISFNVPSHKLKILIQRLTENRKEKSNTQRMSNSSGEVSNRINNFTPRATKPVRQLDTPYRVTSLRLSQSLFPDI